MSDHAFLAPSSADRIVLCHGSALMEARYPDEPTPESQEGNAAHWAASELLQWQQVAVGQVTPAGAVLNNENVDAAELYAGHIKQVGDVEKPIKYCTLHHLNWGTPDHAIFTGELWIDDFKYGHRFVPARRNWQLINYAALKLGELRLYERDDIRVNMTVIQPRNYHRDGPIRTWSATVGELRPYFQQLQEAFVAAAGPDPQVTASPEACRDCKARHECPAAIEAGYEGMAVAGQAEPLVMSAQAMRVELQRLRAAEGIIKARREGIEQSLTAKLKRGESVPYFALERRPGRTVWIDTPPLAVADACGVELRKPNYLTPAQAIAAGLDPQLVKEYSRSNFGAVELAEDDGLSAAEIFGVK